MCLRETWEILLVFQVSCSLKKSGFWIQGNSSLLSTQAWGPKLNPRHPWKNWVYTCSSCAAEAETGSMASWAPSHPTSASLTRRSGWELAQLRIHLNPCVVGTEAASRSLWAHCAFQPGFEVSSPTSASRVLGLEFMPPHQEALRVLRLGLIL